MRASKHKEAEALGKGNIVSGRAGFWTQSNSRRDAAGPSRPTRCFYIHSILVKGDQDLMKTGAHHGCSQSARPVNEWEEEWKYHNMSFVWVKNRRHCECYKPKGQLSYLQKKDWKESHRGQEELDEEVQLWALPCWRSRQFAARVSASIVFLGFPGLLLSASGQQLSGGRTSGHLTFTSHSKAHNMVPSSTNWQLSFMWRVICLPLLGICLYVKRSPLCFS